MDFCYTCSSAVLTERGHALNHDRLSLLPPSLSDQHTILHPVPLPAHPIISLDTFEQLQAIPSERRYCATHLLRFTSGLSYASHLLNTHSAVSATFALEANSPISSQVVHAYRAGFEVPMDLARSGPCLLHGVYSHNALQQALHSFQYHFGRQPAPPKLPTHHVASEDDEPTHNPRITEGDPVPLLDSELSFTECMRWIHRGPAKRFYPRQLDFLVMARTAHDLPSDFGARFIWEQRDFLLEALGLGLPEDVVACSRLTTRIECGQHILTPYARRIWHVVVSPFLGDSPVYVYLGTVPRLTLIILGPACHKPNTGRRGLCFERDLALFDHVSGSRLRPFSYIHNKPLPSPNP